MLLVLSCVFDVRICLAALLGSETREVLRSSDPLCIASCDVIFLPGGDVGLKVCSPRNPVRY